MNLTIEEFQRLADDKSVDALRIAELERQLADKTRENKLLMEELDSVKMSYTASRLENMMLRNYITLSVEKIKMFVARLKGIERFAFLKTFLEFVLPKERYQEQLLLVNEVMTIPTEEPRLPIGDTHNHFEAGSNSQVFNGNVTGQFEKT